MLKLMDKFESALGYHSDLEDWCQKNGLKKNHKKTEIVLFSSRITGSGLVGKIRLFGMNVELSFLEVTFDSRFNFIAHEKV